MPHRSQRHTAEMYGVLRPILSLSPETATIAAVGAVGRAITELSVVGGTPPITYTVAAADTLSLAIDGVQLETAADPVGPTGVKSVQITATDSRGQTKTELIAVTVT